MYTDFEFAGKRLSDFDYIVCKFNSSSDATDVEIGCDITFNSVKNNHSSIRYKTSTSYENVYTTYIEIMKNPCRKNQDELYHQNEEISVLTTWLNRRGYHKFKPLSSADDFSSVHYYGSFNVKEKVINDRVVGLCLSFTGNAPYGFGNGIKNEFEAEYATSLANGDFIHVEDSENAKIVDFGMEGKTEQKTTEGKNLLDTNVERWAMHKLLSWGAVSGTEIGESVSNSTISIAYTVISASPSTSMSFINNTTDKYWVNRIIEADENGIGYINHKLYQDSSTQNLANYSFTTSANTTRLYFQVCLLDATQTFTEADLQEMKILVGYGTITDYEPYTNGPSPNPNFKQEVENAGVYNEETGRYEHKFTVGNKNFWDAEYARDVNNWRTDCASTYIPIYVGKGQKVSVRYKETIQAGLNFYVVISKTNTQHYIQNYAYGWMYHSGSSGLIVKERTFVAEDDYIYVVAYGENWLENFMQYIGNDLQIEIADAPTDLIPHQSQQFTLTSDRPITMWDNMVKRDGVYGWSIWSLIYKLTGDEATIKENYKFDTGHTSYYVLLDGISSTWSGDEPRVYCNQFTYVEGNKIYTQAYTHDFVCSAVAINRIYFASLSSKGIFESVDAFREYLRKSDVKIVCKTSTEQAFIPLPDEEQELLRNMETYYGVTNIYNEQGCPMTIEYVSEHNNSFYLHGEGDEYIVVYPVVTVSPKVDCIDTPLEIVNKTTGTKVVLKNLKAYETIRLHGEHKIIVSDDEEHSSTLYNDFNYEWLDILIKDGFYENEYCVNMPCYISIDYEPIRKVGVC